MPCIEIGAFAGKTCTMSMEDVHLEGCGYDWLHQKKQCIVVANDATVKAVRFPITKELCSRDSY